MKKNKILIIAVGLASVFVSCKTHDQFSLARAMRFDPAIQRELPADSFIVLGSVSGEAEVTNVPQEKNPTYFKGDTRRYGVLDTQDTVLYRPLIGERTILQPSSPYTAALGNATYNIIAELQKMGGDAILYVKTLTEVSTVDGVQTVKVMISGSAVKLKVDKQ